MLNFEELMSKKRVHFVGIGGVGMSALAEFLFNQNILVTGSDLTSNEFVEKLLRLGIKVKVGHNEALVDGCDLVVVNSAIHSENCEILRAEQNHVEMMKREEVLGVVFNHFNRNIAICGMHGKTTTSAMLSCALAKLKMSPTVFVGGNVNALGSNFCLGNSDICVAEACEYKASFLFLKPYINCILNIDEDHLDFYQDLNDIKRTFEKFASQTKQNGVNVVFGDDNILKEFVGIKFGFEKHNDYIAQNLSQKMGKYEFDFFHDGENLGRVKLSVIGRHNALNALCVLSVLDILGVETKLAVKAVESFDGVDRRCTFSPCQFSNVIVDYAHHPNEIKTLLETVKLMGFEKVHLVFQPHTYTRTRGLFQNFVQALRSDKVYVLPTYAARESVLVGFESADICLALRADGVDAEHFENQNEMIETLKKNAKKNDVILLVGAGDINLLSEKLS